MIPVLAGGGTRLPAHVGVLTALEQIQYGIEQLVGISGGLSTGERFESGLGEQLNGATFRHLDCDLHVVATEVSSGQPMISDKERSSDFWVARAVHL